jgi:hypothetical protein
LKTLEEAVFNKPSAQKHSQGSGATNNSGNSTMKPEGISTAHTLPHPVHTPRSPQLPQGPLDLANTCRTADTSSSPRATFNASFPQLEGIGEGVSTLPQPLCGTSFNIRLKLPSLETARTIFGHYTAKLNWACHVIHIPTARQQLEDIYATLEAGGSPKLPHIALVATIMAAVAYFWRGSRNDPSELRPVTEKISAETLEELAREALVEARYLTSPTIETLQAAILMIQFLPNQLQDAAFVGRLTHSAHILQLHLVDSPQNLKERGMEKCDAVEIEVQRRMWRYIASTDW